MISGLGPVLPGRTGGEQAGPGSPPEAECQSYSEAAAVLEAGKMTVPCEPRRMPSPETPERSP